MQLDPWIPSPIDGFRQCAKQGAKEAVDRKLMLFMQCPVHPFRDYSFNEYRTACNSAHQTAHCTVVAYGYQ